MKLHHLIFASVAIFTILFYDEYLGLNFGIFGFILALVLLVKTKKENCNKLFYFLFICSILSAFAFAWYGDTISFLAELSSLLLLRFKSKNRKFNSLFIFPVYFVNFFAFVHNIFLVARWFPKSEKSDNTKKIIAYFLIPAMFIIIFFGVYSLGSNHFSEIFSAYEWNIDFWNLVTTIFLGFFFSFIFWNLIIPVKLYRGNQYLQNEFTDQNSKLKATYSFMDVNYERTSGVISLIALNFLLIIFISTYTYEQFYETVRTANQLSSETHNGVNTVILSIIMAIIVIMFYFKGGFNFDKKATYLKLLAQIWIFLNIVLIFSTIAKNTDYIVNLGFTYKRLGVYAFLILSILGLFFTFLKIKNRKTNAYLFNQMFWCLFGTVLVCSFINWGGIITTQNMKRSDFSEYYHLTDFDFNESQLLEYAKEHQTQVVKYEILKKIEIEQSKTFLSKSLYYEIFNLNEANN